LVTGRVKSFNAAKRYGFIQPDSGVRDVFFHVSQVESRDILRLRKGQRVSFEIVDGKGKQFAEKLRVGTPNGAEEVALSPMPVSRDRTTTKRKLIAREALEMIITQAIRSSNRKCEQFVGIFVQAIVTKTRGEVNWVVQGVRYGTADRAQCDLAISDVVTHMQQEFVIFQ
jgi:cold shock CspA family protein